jgi:hypothetical protein
VNKPIAPTPSGRIMLRNVRLSFAQGLFAASTIPGAADDAEPKFNCGLLLPPDHPQVKEINDKTVKVATEKWKDKAAGVLKALTKQDRLALHDGDVKPNYDGYPGNFFLSPSSPEAKPPGLMLTIDGKVVSHLDLEGMELKEFMSLVRRKLYSGCYVDASIELWAQDNGFGQRVNAQLRGVLFRKDGDAFGAGGAAGSDEFEPAAEGADAEDIG